MDADTSGRERPRLGVSQCLLGDRVRYDGGHKRDAFLGSLGGLVEWAPVCPEVEVGMGTPREAVHLVIAADGVPSRDAQVRLLGVRTRRDWTDAMVSFSRRRVEELSAMNLSGYVLKSKSPSCGMERVALRPDIANAPASPHGRGLFAQELMMALPNLPVEEEGRLNDPMLRANFLERVFAYHRVRGLWRSRWTAGSLVRFHTAHKLQLLAHARTGYTSLGRIVAAAGITPRRELAAAYESAFMRTLTRPATPARHADVMTHILGHFKRLLDDGDRAELLAAIDAHRRGMEPLDVPLTLIRHHVRRHGVAYLQAQTYVGRGSEVEK